MQTPAPFQGALSWDEIAAVVRDDRPDKFSRFPDVLAGYIKWRADMDEHYCSAADFIKIEVLAYPYVVESGRKRATGGFDPPGLKDLVLRENDFPYAMKEGIRHFVLWYLGEEELSRDQVATILEKKMPDYEFIPPPSTTDADVIDLAQETDELVVAKEEDDAVGRARRCGGNATSREPTRHSTAV
ncbi:hypothetical protein HK101_010489 [Irineochytrium annulatum]|nr:hypothetical protein HK101_010489 [Irineochytrium annulatum]